MRMLKSSRMVRGKEQGVRRFIFLLLLSIMSFLAPHSSLLTEVKADEYHYNNILVGDRPAGMGGAYAAVSDDPSGLYYNPAGIVYTTGRSFSASVNAFHYSYKKYKDVLGGKGWERISSNLLPNYFGIIQPLGKGKIGFSYAVPDSRSENQDQTFYSIPGFDPATSLPLTITRYVINMNDTDYTYNFGPSYAMKINDRLSIGSTAYVHYRDRELISNQLVNVDDGRYEWGNTYGSLTEWGIKPNLGLLWSPADKVSVGLTLSKTYLFDTDRRLQTTYRGLDYGSTEAAYNDWNSSDHREFPLVTTVGIAYFPSETLLLSADISHYEAVSYTLKYKNKVSGATSSESISQERVINTAVGAEYYPTERIALRGGLFTDISNAPDLSSSKADQPEQINLYGASASISSYTRSSSLTVGGSYSAGAGEAQPYSGSTAIKDVEVHNYTAFISAAFSY